MSDQPVQRGMHIPTDIGGSTRRKMPAPFRRPSVDLGGGPKRDWKYVRACDLQTGDIVPGLGQVTHVDEIIEHPGAVWTVEARNAASGITRRFAGDELIQAFAA